MAKSASPTVRALDELKAYHDSEISKIGREDIEKNDSCILTIKRESEKEAVEKIVKALQQLDIPYTLEHTTLCNVRQYSGELRFILSFDTQKDKRTAIFEENTLHIKNKREKERCRLNDWYISSLYRITMRDEIPRFELENKDA
jgi:hypothetical protein